MSAKQQKCSSGLRHSAEKRSESDSMRPNARGSNCNRPQRPPVAQLPSQVARLEPETKLRARESVAVPAATVTGRDHLSRDWTFRVPTFRIDVAPVSNKEFLEFVRANPQWKRSQISTTLHDGDYLKHWEGDETINAKEADRPVRYVSYSAAEAYCKSVKKALPWLNHYRAATKLEERGSYAVFYVSYDVSYTPPDFNFVDTEWTASWWASSPDPGKRIPFQHGSLHSRVPGSPHYAPERDKRDTGRSLGFRCVEYS